MSDHAQTRAEVEASEAKSGWIRRKGPRAKNDHSGRFLTLPCLRSTIAGICAKSATLLPPRADRQGCLSDNTFRIQNLAAQSFAPTI